MRRRRQPLQPSTFPFLAVLLCAMGSLILILLVMDRQARLAARAKAERQARELAGRRRAEREETEQQERKRLRLLEARRQERETRHARLVREKEALEGRRDRLQGQLRAAERAFREDEVRGQHLRQDLAREEERLASAKEAWARRREAWEAASRQVVALREEIASLSAGIAALEKELADRKSARARAGRTYSVVPYKGKRGSDRRPVYVECDANGLVFHPDGLALSLTWEPLRILAELQKRTAPDGPGDRPYVLALVRPEGIRHYYPLQAALHRLGVDFGYELIDADWVLAFPGEGQRLVEPWGKHGGAGDSGPRVAKAGRGRGGRVPANAVALSRPHPGSLLSGAPHPGPLTPGGRGVASSEAPLPHGGKGVGVRGKVARRSAADVAASLRDAGGSRGDPPTVRGKVARRSTADVTASGSDSPTGTGGVARRSAAEKSRDGVAGHPGEGHFPVVPGLEHGKGEGKGGSGVPPLLVGAVPPPPQPGGGEGGKGTTPSSPEGKGDDIASPRPFFPEGVPQPRPFAPGGKGEESSEAPRPSGGTEGERKGRPSGAGNDHPPSVAADCPRPAKGKGNSPWKPARPIEQRPDRQGPPPSPVIFPGSRDPQRDRKPRSRRNLLEPVVPGPGAARRPAWLTGEQPRSVFVECRVGGAIVYPSRRAFTVAQLQAASNPLLAEVRRLLPTGGSRRSQIHFLVWPEGMRTYHTVYPLLDSLDVPKRRRNLQTGDDMGYILANE